MQQIAIVDADSQQRSCLALALRMAGYAVQEANNLEQGLDLLTDGAVDLMLIDLMIPGGQALQLAHEATSRVPTVEVVMTGGYSLSRARMQRAGLDPSAFFAKPYSMSALSRFVEYRLQQKRPRAPAVA